MRSSGSLFDQSLNNALKTGLRVFRDFPESRASLKQVLGHLPGAAMRRSAWRKRGIIVPPLLIVSATRRCNLNCAGCYAKPHRCDAQDEMTREQMDGLLAQAVEAGCSFILLAGGEPLLRTDWLEAVASRPELLGLVFTNGTLMDDGRADWFAGNRNAIPLFSVEGDAKKTDERRGAGVAERIEQAMRKLSERTIPFGLSITTGEHNIRDVARMDFLQPFVRLGCRLSIFTEYVPGDDSEELLALTEKSKYALDHFCREATRKENMLLIAFPGDETAHGGCLAAGRGFAHISASGSLEPCPFAAYSDRNVLDASLIDALASPLFEKLRAESHLLHEGAGGCALRDLGEAMLASLSGGTAERGAEA